MQALDAANFYIDRSRQSWFMKQHFEHKGRRLRFVVESNAYAANSSARVQIQDQASLSWNYLASIPASQMQTRASYVVERLSAKDQAGFLEDLAELKRQAEMLI